MTSIKADPGLHAMNGLEPRIKRDPDSVGASPAPHSEEDIYEDAGDLEFTRAEQGLFLTRVPKFLWESWSKLDDNQEVHIGTIRVEGTPGDIKRMSLLLARDLAQGNEVPGEYNMHITNQDTMNTFVFSEKDLPGYRSYSHDRAPPRFKDRKRVDKFRKSETNFRRAIPKQTGLAGKIGTEINCLPVENADYQRVMERRAARAFKPKQEIQVLKDIASGSILNPGMGLGSSGDFKSFITHTGPTRGKKQEFKAARMPQNELLDLILDCFKQFTYWSLKVLKSRVDQPEAYLKETLDKVAVLIKTGPHAMTYQLRPEAMEGRYAEAGIFDQVKEETAPGMDSDSDEVGGAEEDDENVKMEDVLPE